MSSLGGDEGTREDRSRGWRAVEPEWASSCSGSGGRGGGLCWGLGGSSLRLSRPLRPKQRGMTDAPRRVGPNFLQWLQPPRPCAHIAQQPFLHARPVLAGATFLRPAMPHQLPAKLSPNTASLTPSPSPGPDQSPWPNLEGSSKSMWPAFLSPNPPPVIQPLSVEHSLCATGRPRPRQDRNLSTVT